MKLLKKIYYPIMALLVVAFIVIGFVSSTVASPLNRVDDAFMTNVLSHTKTIAQTSDRNTTIDESNITTPFYSIVNMVDSLVDSEGNKYVYNAGDVNTNDDGDTASSFNNGEYSAPTMVAQKSIPTSSTLSKMGDSTLYVNRVVYNLVVYIPGSKTLSSKTAENVQSTADAVLITARYDSIGDEATSASIIGSMVENIRLIVESKTSYANDFVFLFQDGGLDNSLGLHVFANQFIGFDKVYDRTTLAFNFDTMGTSGPLVMHSGTGNESKLVGELSSIGGLVASSFIEDALDSSTASTVFGKKLSMSFTNMGNEELAGSDYDTYENLNMSVVESHANMMNAVIDKFGSSDLTALADGSDSSVYFSFASLFTINYSTQIALILSALAFALIVAIILINNNKKTFNFIKAVIGGIISLVAFAGATIVLYLVYFMTALLMGAFSIIDINTIMTLSYLNIGMLLSACVIAGAVMVGLYVILKNAFQVKASDVVKGNIFLIAIVSIVFSFVLPSVSYAFSILAILQLITLLVTTALKDKFKAKFGYDIDRLFLQVWPVVLTMPLFITAMYIVGMTSLTIMLPVITVVFMALGGALLPFADFLKPSLDKVAKKLPPITLRYEQVVTEMQEDKAKKGKFTEVTYKKTFKKKTPWSYLNRVGIIAVCFIASITMVCFSAVGGNIYYNVSGQVSTDNYYEYKSVNYVLENNDGVETKTLQVADLSIYKTVSEFVTDLEWNSESNLYSKTSTYDTSMSPTINQNVNQIIFEKAGFSADSSVKVTFTGVAGVTEFAFNAEGSDAVYTFENVGKLDTVTFAIPQVYGSKFVVEYVSASNISDIGVTYEESCEAKTNMYNNIKEISNLINNYISTDDESIVLNYNIIYRNIFTVNSVSSSGTSN